MKLTSGAITHMASLGIPSLEIPEICTSKTSEIVPDDWIERVQFFPGGKPCRYGGVLCLSERGFMANQERLKQAFLAAGNHGFSWSYFVWKAMFHFIRSFATRVSTNGSTRQQANRQLCPVQPVHPVQRFQAQSPTKEAGNSCGPPA